MGEKQKQSSAAPQVVLEQIVPFSRSTVFQKSLSASLGVLNLAGVAWMGKSGVMYSAALIAKEPFLMSVLPKVRT